MFKAPGIHSLCQFHPITFVKAKIDFLAVHCHMVPWGVYSIGPVAVKDRPDFEPQYVIWSETTISSHLAKKLFFNSNLHSLSSRRELDQST